MRNRIVFQILLVLQQELLHLTSPRMQWLWPGLSQTKMVAVLSLDTGLRSLIQRVISGSDATNCPSRTQPLGKLSQLSNYRNNDDKSSANKVKDLYFWRNGVEYFFWLYVCVAAEWRDSPPRRSTNSVFWLRILLDLENQAQRLILSSSKIPLVCHMSFSNATLLRLSQKQL